MAGTIGGLPTVADPALFSLIPTQFIDNNYNRFNGLCRAMKVFQRCFLQYKSFNQNIYQQMSGEFFNAMIDLFGVQNDQRIHSFGPIMNAIDQEVITEPMIMSIGVTELTPREILRNARVTIELGHIQHQNNQIVLNLNVSQTQQNSSFVNQTIRFYDIDSAIRQDRQIVIRYADCLVGHQWRQFQPISIWYRQLHNEGFHQRLRFGQTSILFCIEFKSIEANYNELIVNSFHLQTILYAFQNRLNDLRAQPPYQQLYRHTDPKILRHVTYDVNQVNPNSRDAFWGTTPNVALNNQNICRLKYTDLQIGYQLGEEFFSESLCSCNEFCNMNAFFYYNPIYRFLLVQHNRHYVRNKTLVANIYQLTLTILTTHMTPILLTPVFNLWNTSSERLNENHVLFHKKPVLKNLWRNSVTNGKDMEALVYISLFNCSLTDIMAATYGQVHFDENAFEAIKNLMERLFELHQRIAYYHKYIRDDPYFRQYWFQEYECRSHTQYFRYLNHCFTTTLTSNQMFEENLFTRDYEVTAHPNTNAQRNQLFRWRKIEHKSFEQNITFNMRCFTYAINQLWLSVTRFEPSSALYSRTGLREQFNTFQGIHDLMDQTLKTPNFYQHLTQITQQSDQLLQNQLTLNTRLLFLQFYKLKVYSRVFKIQNKFLDALFKHNHRNHAMRLGFAFEGLWNDFWIEILINTTQPLPEIFQKNNTFITLINDFYQNFWLPPTHDRPGPIPLRAEVQTSIFDEYAKRRYWDRIDGYTRQRFQDIITAYEDSLNTLNTQSETFYNQILNAMQDIKAYYANQEPNLTEDQKNYCLILDVVYFWLLKATLYLITGTVAEFLRTINGLHSTQLVQNKTQYFISKPGLVQLFKTVDMVLRKVDEIHQHFVAFSNPFDNMGEAIRQTKYNIRMLYKNFWYKLVNDWYIESQEFFITTSVGDIDMIKLHTIGGASFLISYVDHSRQWVEFTRKSVTQLRNRPQFQATVTHIHFRNIWDICLNWFRNMNRNEVERPFILNRWTAQLGTAFTQMDAKDLSRLQS